ncbi:hypothetical protein D3C75_958800 [compost metagenome]
MNRELITTTLDLHPLISTTPTWGIYNLKKREFLITSGLGCPSILVLKVSAEDLVRPDWTSVIVVSATSKYKIQRVVLTCSVISNKAQDHTDEVIVTVGRLEGYLKIIVQYVVV